MLVRRGATGGEGAQRGRPVSGADVLLCFKLPCAVDPRDGLDNGGGKMWIHKNGREDAPFGKCSRGGGRRGFARGHAREGVVVGRERHGCKVLD